MRYLIPIEYWVITDPLLTLKGRSFKYEHWTLTQNIVDMHVRGS